MAGLELWGEAESGRSVGLRLYISFCLISINHNGVLLRGVGFGALVKYNIILVSKNKRHSY